jgi:hypothetical protein
VTVHRGVERNGVDHVDLGRFESRMVCEMSDVAGATGDVVVEAQHLVAAGDQRVAQVRAEKAGAAGDEDAHQRRPTPS